MYAFLNDDLEEISATQLQGFQSSIKSLVCHLRKAIYGLKQVPRAWFEHLKQTLLHMVQKTTKFISHY